MIWTKCPTASMLLYSCLHIQFFFCWNIDVTTNTFLGFRSDVDGCGHCRAISPGESLQSCLEVGARVAGAALLIYRLCAVTKRMRSSGWNSFCWLGGWAPSKMEVVHWGDKLEEISWSHKVILLHMWRSIGDGVCSEIYVADHQQ